MKQQFTYSGETLLKVVAALRVMKALALDEDRTGLANEIVGIISALADNAPELFGYLEGPKKS